MNRPILALCVATIVLELPFYPVSAQEQVTEMQEAHSHLFPEYKSGRNIREEASRGSGDLVVIKPVRATAMGGGGVNVRSPSGNAYLDYLSPRADAVVIGTLKNKSSQLTDDGEFLFSDYVMVVNFVAKPAAIAPNSEITVTRAGGEILLNGRTVRAIDPFFKPFQLGQSYILFLKLIPETGAYMAHAEGTFRIVGGKVMNHPLYGPTGGENDYRLFWDDVLASVKATGMEEIR
jgi:hypothetical protein